MDCLPVYNGIIQVTVLFPACEHPIGWQVIFHQISNAFRAIEPDEWEVFIQVYLLYIFNHIIHELNLNPVHHRPIAVALKLNALIAPKQGHGGWCGCQQYRTVIKILLNARYDPFHGIFPELMLCHQKMALVKDEHIPFLNPKGFLLPDIVLYLVQFFISGRRNLFAGIEHVAADHNPDIRDVPCLLYCVHRRKCYEYLAVLILLYYLFRHICQCPAFP